MADWVSQYSAALKARDVREKAHKTYIDAYTKLADRTAALEGLSTRPPQQEDAAVTQEAQSPARPAPSRAKSPHTEGAEVASPQLLARLRVDLAATQRSRAELQGQLSRLQSDLNMAAASSKTASRRIEGLLREKRELEHKVSDRDAELRMKSRMVNDAQDQMIAMTLQLNINEEKMNKIYAENDMLVKRWMTKMGEEAEKMNTESRWA
ncbi:hypothetical protein MBLNU459_g4758t1 [Dothideomycetes sp. NU459]